jgi:hypothetical protein
VLANQNVDVIGHDGARIAGVAAPADRISKRRGNDLHGWIANLQQWMLQRHGGLFVERSHIGEAG